MATIHHFSPEEQAELLNNPYTARVTECRVYFTLAFKKFVIQTSQDSHITARQIFAKAGYRNGLFTSAVMRYIVRSIKEEAASESGLKEPKIAPKSNVKKKRSETEFRELEHRVKVLEQQIDFLKKRQHLRKTGQMILPPNSG